MMIMRDDTDDDKMMVMKTVMIKANDYASYRWRAYLPTYLPSYLPTLFVVGDSHYLVLPLHSNTVTVTITCRRHVVAK